MPIEIRSVAPDDWRLWRDVRLRALKEAPYAFGSVLAAWSGENDTEARWRGRLENVPYNAVAIVDGVPAGQVGAVGPDAGVCELISMWVDPTVRGNGVGERLVASVVEWARGAAAHAGVLHVKRDNAPAIALYERCGFLVTASADDTPGDEQRMIRAL